MIGLLHKEPEPLHNYHIYLLFVFLLFMYLFFYNFISQIPEQVPKEPLHINLIYIDLSFILLFIIHSIYICKLSYLYL